MVTITPAPAPGSAPVARVRARRHLGLAFITALVVSVALPAGLAGAAPTPTDETSTARAVIQQAKRVAAPVIAKQPKKRIVAKGKKAKFKVKVRTSSSTSYRWYVKKKHKVWAPVKKKGTSAKLKVKAKKKLNKAKYRAVVRTAGATLTSKKAKLIVVTKPKIVTQPSGNTARKGASVTLAVKAKGGKLAYVWQQSGSATGPWRAVTKATKKKLTIKAAAAYAFYRVVVTNKAGSATSTVAAIAVPDSKVGSSPLRPLATNATVGNLFATPLVKLNLWTAGAFPLPRDIAQPVPDGYAVHLGLFAYPEGGTTAAPQTHLSAAIVDSAGTVKAKGHITPASLAHGPLGAFYPLTVGFDVTWKTGEQRIVRVTDSSGATPRSVYYLVTWK